MGRMLCWREGATGSDLCPTCGTWTWVIVERRTLMFENGIMLEGALACFCRGCGTRTGLAPSEVPRLQRLYRDRRAGGRDGGSAVG